MAGSQHSLEDPVPLRGIVCKRGWWSLKSSADKPSLRWGDGERKSRYMTSTTEVKREICKFLRRKGLRRSEEEHNRKRETMGANARYRNHLSTNSCLDILFGGQRYNAHYAPATLSLALTLCSGKGEKTNALSRLPLKAQTRKRRRRDAGDYQVTSTTL